MIHRLNFRAMNTDMLVCVDVESDQPPALLAEIPHWFEEWEQSLSRFRPDSELSRLNQTIDQPVPVSPMMWEVFQAARQTEQFTDGLVTPTVLDAVLSAGYDRTFDSLPREQEVGASGQTAVRPLASVKFDEARRTISLPRSVHLDFGGIAKGWAADQAMRRMSAVGPTLMNAGGDVAISGPLRDGSPWEIGVFDPFDRSQEYIEMLFLEGGAVATSGKERRHWMQGGQFRHHIIDPRTGLSAETDVLTATIVASNVLEAEAAAKSVLIRGSMDGLDWLEANPSLAGLLVLDNGEMLYSQKIVEYL